MSDLTLEKMDKINFLITEVSLECLGNGFFDIYGEKCPSLLGLISANTLRPKPTNLDNESDLASALAIDSIPSNNLNQTSKSDETHDRKKKKRRASCSIEINNEMDVSADPESLLVPMAYIPKAAKIANRRSTIAVQRKLTTFISPPKPQPPKSIEEIKQNLRHDINARKIGQFFFTFFSVFIDIKGDSLNFVFH